MLLCQLCYRIGAPRVTPHHFVPLFLFGWICNYQLGGAPDICCLAEREVLAQCSWTQPKNKANIIQVLTMHSPSERNLHHHWLSPQRQLEWDTKRNTFVKPHRNIHLYTENGAVTQLNRAQIIWSSRKCYGSFTWSSFYKGTPSVCILCLAWRLTYMIARRHGIKISKWFSIILKSGPSFLVASCCNYSGIYSGC